MVYAKSTGVFRNPTETVEERIGETIRDLQGNTQKHRKDEENSHFLLFEKGERPKSEHIHQGGDFAVVVLEIFEEKHRMIALFLGLNGVPVRKAVKAGVEVQCLPGATAFVPALVSSGLPCDRFVFEGFLPQKKGRQTKIQSLAGEERTMIFYESPYRVVKTLEQFAEAFGGNRPVSVCREISKVHEESVRGTLAEVIAHFKEHEPRGEFVIVLGGNKVEKSEN